MPKIYLVDLENVVPKALPKFGAEDKICVFIGAKQLKLNTKMVMELQNYGKQVEYIEISGSGKNSADFHIAFFLGKLFSKSKNFEFVIISKDKGFDPLVEYLNREKNCCSRKNEFITPSPKKGTKTGEAKSTLKGKKINATTTSEHLEQLKTSLSKNNNRPKHIKGLNSYGVNLLNIPPESVEVLIEKLVAEKFLTLEKTKIVYN